MVCTVIVIIRFWTLGPFSINSFKLVDMIVPYERIVEQHTWYIIATEAFPRFLAVEIKNIKNIKI